MHNKRQTFTLVYYCVRRHLWRVSAKMELDWNKALYLGKGISYSIENLKQVNV